MNALAKLEGATRALAEAKTLDEIKQIRDISKAAAEYARAAKLGLEAQNHAAEIKLRAERKAGEFLASLEKSKGGRPSNNLDQPGPSFSEYKQTLDEAEISRSSAKRWQKIATIPATSFEEFVIETKTGDRELTSAAAVRVAKQNGANGNMKVHYSSEDDEWATPQELFDLLNQEFGFTLDVCARPESAKCGRFFTPEDDGLAQDWVDDVAFMNPPYGRDIKHWVRRAYKSGKKGGTVVCLVPARVDTAWWWDYCTQGEVRFLRGRLRFGDATSGAPFPSAVVVFRGKEPSVTWWKKWRPKE